MKKIRFCREQELKAATEARLIKQQELTVSLEAPPVAILSDDKNPASARNILPAMTPPGPTPDTFSDENITKDIPPGPAPDISATYNPAAMNTRCVHSNDDAPPALLSSSVEHAPTTAAAPVIPATENSPVTKSLTKKGIPTTTPEFFPPTMSLRLSFPLTIPLGLFLLLLYFQLPQSFFPSMMLPTVTPIHPQQL